MTSNEQVLRYTPGQDYAFLHCKFKRSFVSGMKIVYTSGLQLSTYYPWDVHHHLLNLEVVKLRCVDHHKVPWDQDPYGEAKYDGFVFQEVTGNPPRRWFNQYPRASYGQIDTRGDHHLYLDYVGAGMSTKEVVAEAATDKGMTELQDAVQYLGNIRRGRVQIAKSGDWTAADKEKALASLGVFEAKVHALIENAMGKKLKLMQIMYEPPADGQEPVILDWFDVVFEDEPEYLHKCWEDGRGQKRLVPPLFALED